MLRKLYRAWCGCHDRTQSRHQMQSTIWWSALDPSSFKCNAGHGPHHVNAIQASKPSAYSYVSYVVALKSVNKRLGDEPTAKLALPHDYVPPRAYQMRTTGCPLSGPTLPRRTAASGGGVEGIPTK